VSSIPKEGEVLNGQPGQISLKFTETLEPDLVSVRLYNWNGEEIKLEPPTLQPGDASQVNARLPELPTGTYTAIVAVVSEDGHPVEERLSFSIGEKSATVVEPNGKKPDSTYLIAYRYVTQGIILLGGGLYLFSWRGQAHGLPTFSAIVGNGRQIGWSLALIGLCFLWFLYDESLPAVSLTEALLQGNGEVLSCCSWRYPT
jgi:copper transport protein